MADITAQERDLGPRAWLDRHGDYLYRFALARARREADAEDLVQETLLAAWKGRAEFSGQASERTWLTAILKRKIVDWLRRQVRSQTVELGDSAPDTFAAKLFSRRGVWKLPPGSWERGDPTAPLEREEFWATLHTCLGKLPPRFREVFVLRYMDDSAADDICQEQGLTRANFWVILYRARIRMWQCLSQNWYGEKTATGGVEP